LLPWDYNKDIVVEFHSSTPDFVQISLPTDAVEMLVKVLGKTAPSNPWNLDAVEILYNKLADLLDDE
jgi:hypothetical protein